MVFFVRALYVHEHWHTLRKFPIDGFSTTLNNYHTCPFTAQQSILPSIRAILVLEAKAFLPPTFFYTRV